MSDDNRDEDDLRYQNGDHHNGDDDGPQAEMDEDRGRSEDEDQEYRRERSESPVGINMHTR